MASSLASRALRRATFAALLAFAAAACGSSEEGPASLVDGEKDRAATNDKKPGGEDGDEAISLEEKPWEVLSNKGETYLPNVFYADAVENEQIMPTALDGHAMIDRLVYPTLGNPNLYVKGDRDDEMMAVLRVEESLFAHLAPRYEPEPPSSLTRVTMTQTATDSLAILLVSRKARTETTSSVAVSATTGSGVYRVTPSAIFASPEPDDMPAELKKRKTLRFVFDQAAMARVPAGLYDIRFEVRKDAALYAPKGDGVFEYQYNAVRVFDSAVDEYDVLNVTDTQVSVGALYDSKTKAKLEQFVAYVNTTSDPLVRNSAFITFNGDLHNGGSPGTIRQRKVAWTYNDEAKVIVEALKNLTLPIFLTVGNHDGYVAIGHAPAAVKTIDSTLLDSLEKVVNEASPKAWPGFQWDEYAAFLERTKGVPGGVHLDIYSGAFTRLPGQSFGESFVPVPRSARNYILYDGFYQWQRTYGPLYASWKFGKNAYVNMNSFDLRQHRRSGWGMYTVNYGGGLSRVQLEWIDRELARAKKDSSDVVMLAHHDPRGGHKGEDFGWLSEQLEFSGMSQSAVNYIVESKISGFLCKAPDWALPASQEQDCLHDGLQEWMRPDLELDCDVADRTPEGVCNHSLFDFSLGDKRKRYHYSGMDLVERLAKKAAVRTVLLGHTHFNSLEVLQDGAPLLPATVDGDQGAGERFDSYEAQNPVRGNAWESGATEPGTVSKDVIHTKNDDFYASYEAHLSGRQRTVIGKVGETPRELAIMRLTSCADLTHQTYDGKAMVGFTVLAVRAKADERAVAQPQINKATFFINGGSTFSRIATIDVPRTWKLEPHDSNNPVEELFNW